jgi:hypothetical protein
LSGGRSLLAPSNIALTIDAANEVLVSLTTSSTVGFANRILHAAWNTGLIIAAGMPLYEIKFLGAWIAVGILRARFRLCPIEDWLSRTAYVLIEMSRFQKAFTAFATTLVKGI